MAEFKVTSRRIIEQFDPTEVQRDRTREYGHQQDTIKAIVIVGLVVLLVVVVVMVLALLAMTVNRKEAAARKESESVRLAQEAEVEALKLKAEIEVLEEQVRELVAESNASDQQPTGWFESTLSIPSTHGWYYEEGTTYFADGTSDPFVHSTTW